MQASRNIKGSVISKHRINFRCNICGDSLNKRNVKRGFLLFNSKQNSKYWVYKCQRPQCDANVGWSAEKWLKKTDEFLFNCFKTEVRHLDRGDTNSETIKNNILKLRAAREAEIESINAKKISTEKHDTKFFVPILKGTDKIFSDAVEYCKNRKLDESIWSKFYVAIDGRYKNRLIIPFFDSTGGVYYWQGRHLYGGEPKYLNRMVDKSEIVYNIHSIDKTKPVVVLEGPIDSCFINNSVATLGLQFSEKNKKLFDTLDAYYLFDNDEAGNTKARQYIKLGKPVFLWSRFIKDKSLTKDIKDVNDLVIRLGVSSLDFNDIKEYFTNNYVDVLYF